MVLEGIFLSKIMLRPPEEFDWTQKIQLYTRSHSEQNVENSDGSARKKN